MVKGGLYKDCVLSLMIFHRLAYSVHMIDLLLAQENSNEIYIMYDIACTLEKHLKVCVYNN